MGCFYQDGVLIKTISSSGDPILAGNLAIGRMNHPAYDAFNGKIDDFGIWNRALTPCEVAGLYQSKVVTPKPSSVSIGANIQSYCGKDSVKITATSGFKTYAST